MFYFPVSSIPPDEYCHESRIEVCSEWEQTPLSSRNGKFFGDKKFLKITYPNSPSLYSKENIGGLKKKIKGKQVIESSWLSRQQKSVSERQCSSEPLEINGVELTWSLQQFCAQVLLTNQIWGWLAFHLMSSFYLCITNRPITLFRTFQRFTLILDKLSQFIIKSFLFSASCVVV